MTVASRHGGADRAGDAAAVLQVALARRMDALASIHGADSATTNAYRLVHGAADGLAGLFVDRFGEALIVHADAEDILAHWLPSLEVAFHPSHGLPSLESALPPVVHADSADVLSQRLSSFESALPPVVHADSADVLSQRLPGLESLHSGSARSVFARSALAVAKVHPRGASRAQYRERLLWGEAIDEITVSERGVRYAIHPVGAMNVGLFLDMREVRSWLRANAGGRTVLNLFAYTCSFGVSAALGGAARVLNLDLSRHYLEWGKRNYELNGLAPTNEDFVYGDAFDWLTRFARRQQPFDLVIVDPPSFSSSRSSTFSVENDYTRLIELAARVVAPGGMLLAATNHAGTSDTRFDAWLRLGLKTAGRRAQLTHRWQEPAADFPGRHPYLKVRALTLD